VTAAVAPRAPLWRGLEEVPADWGPCVVTIGVFDGIHRGHARVLGRAVELARERGVPAVLVTFDPHPSRVVGRLRDVAALSTPGRRAELAADLGVDAVLVLPFTRELAALSPAAFVESVLVRRLHPRAIVIGADFRFGARAAGDVSALAALGARHGFDAEGVDLHHVAAERCSSTRVRSCLTSGDVTTAARLLGRPHRVEGRLDGDLLHVPPGTAVPATGCYVGLLSTTEGVASAVDVVVHGTTVWVHGAGAAVGDAVGPAALDFLPEPSR
jgi:riboflavin kinase / FMN adenylyltransferase